MAGRRVRPELGAMLSRAVPESPPSHDGARVPAQGARGRLPVELAGSVLRGRLAVPILWSLFWGGRTFYQLLRSLEGVGPRSLEAELGVLASKGVVRHERAGGRSRWVLTRAGERLKLVLGAMHQWGLSALADPETAPGLRVEEDPGSAGIDDSGAASPRSDRAGR